MKKIINSLTETVSEKDLAIGDLKKVNKDLNLKLIEMNKIHMEEAWTVCYILIDFTCDIYL